MAATNLARLGSLLPAAFAPAALFALGACSGDIPASGVGAASLPSVDRAVPVVGVADRGDDPAVVAVQVGGEELCSGVLVAPDVVLTARSCVTHLARSPACPSAVPRVLVSRAPASLRVLVGEDAASAAERARGRGLVLPPGDDLCGADIALLLLDQPIDDVQPLPVRSTGAAKGAHVRAVGFGPAAVANAVKLLLDHLRVVDTTPEELAIAEASVPRLVSGSAVIDEVSGQVVGILSRATVVERASCGAYTRADRYFALVEEAIGQSEAAPVTSGAYRLKAKKGPPDMGANCSRGADCASGACVTVGAERYCSRSCDAHDHCPAHFRCERSVEGDAICVHT
jgi:hypothetical protein